MSNEKQKTVEDIVVELRDWNKHTFLDDYDHAWCVSVADRIEAAHQREVAELRECLKETIVIAAAEYHYHSCFKHVKCGEIERCKTCKVVRWCKALKGTSND